MFREPGGTHVKFKRSTIILAVFVMLVAAGIEVAQSQPARPPATAPSPMLVQAGGPTQCRMAIRGTKQGQFKGQSTGRGQEKWIPCSQFLLSLTAPRDNATGVASGRRQYSPIVVTKDWGAASPQIMSAAATNELLPSVEFEFLRTNAQGMEYVFQTVTLTHPTISAFKEYIGFPDAGEPPNPHPLEDVSFTFQKIEVTNNDGKTTAMDDWSTR